MKKEKIKNKGERKNTGITLITLVITIIVLLILAGVTIATLTGENGILSRASEASEQTGIGDEKEQISLAYTGVLADKNGQGEVTAEKLQKEFEKNGRTDVQASGENPITVTFESGREYTIDENGKISDPVETNIMATIKIEGTKVTQEEVEDNIPEGFYHVGETKIEDGLVISSVEGDDLENSKGGNQFVWVPVDRNQKIKINVTSKAGNIESISLTDPYGDPVPLTDTDNLGTSYSNEEIEPTINGPYILKIITEKENKEIILRVHSLYAIDSMTDWLITDEFIATQFGEKGITDIKSLLEYASQQMGYEYTLGDLYISMRYSIIDDYSETEDYTKSINDNGGFYIGRYEASYENGNAVSKVSTGDNTSSTLENGMLWNWISQTDALDRAKKMYENQTFTSSLLTGAAWDRTLGWLEETGVVSAFEIVGDSKSWGNYTDDTFSNTTELINTGQYSETEKNHIYDLAGNLNEWTTESHDNDSRVYRGRCLQ